MNRSALVLAAHGSRSDEAANAVIRRHARRIATMTEFDEVAVAFHYGCPTFATVLDTLHATDVTVVPVMTSEGYFSTQVLPRELRRNHRYPLLRLRQTKPIGTLPGVKTLVRGRIADVLRRFEFELGDTTIVVIGHGTERHGRSGSATVELATDLIDATSRAQVLHAFLDQPPYLRDVCDCVTTANLLALPFLIGGGDHATRDIPARLGLTIPPGATLPFAGRVGSQVVICDAPVGTYPRIADLIAETVGPLARSQPYQPARVA